MKPLLVFLISIFLSVFSASGSEKDIQQMETLLSTSREHMVENEFEQAYEDAFAAMLIAEKANSDMMKAKCLCSLASVDIATSRDSLAWERAVQAEALARKCKADEYLAVALIIKAQVCVYAEIGPDGPHRNKEGLVYIEEALPICEAEGMERYLFEALSCGGQLLVNENRWKEPIDQKIYKRAGELFDRAQAVAEQLSSEEMLRKITMIKGRRYRQGGMYHEALAYFNDILGRSSETDYLMRYQIYDQMTNLYSELDSTVQAVFCHRNTVENMIHYMTQKSDEKLHAIEAQHKAEIKDHRIKILGYRIYALIATLFIAAISLAWLMRRVKKARIKNQNLTDTNIALAKDNEVKEQVISFISPDISSPDKKRSGVLGELSDQCLFLDNEEQIREHCDKVLSEYKMAPEVSQFITDSMLSRRKRAELLGISPREIQVIHLCRQGLSSAEIADKLFISVNTVSTHKRNIYSKLEVSNTAEMIKKSLTNGLI